VLWASPSPKTTMPSSRHALRGARSCQAQATIRVALGETFSLGWTYVAVRRGARVTAVDRADLREDLMQHRNVRFERGDAFRFEPTSPVDWLLCDVIASAERSAERLLEWLRRKWCRHFVVTLKVDHAGSGAILARLKRELPDLTSELGLLRLCANKKEVCAFGAIA